MFFQWGTAVNAYHDQQEKIADRKDRAEDRKDNRAKSRINNMQTFYKLAESIPEAKPQQLVGLWNELGLGGDPLMNVEKFLANKEAERKVRQQEQQFAMMERQQKMQGMANQFVASVAPKVRSYNELEQLVIGQYGDSDLSKQALMLPRNNFTGWRKQQMSNWLTAKAPQLKGMDYNQRNTVVKNTWGDDAQDVMNGWEEQRINEFYTGLRPNLKQYAGLDDDKLETTLKGEARLAGYNPDMVRIDAFRDVMEPFQHEVIAGLQKEYDNESKTYKLAAVKQVDETIKNQGASFGKNIEAMSGNESLKAAMKIVGQSYVFASPNVFNTLTRHAESKRDRYEDMLPIEIAQDLYANARAGNIKGISKDLIQTKKEAVASTSSQLSGDYRPTESFAATTANEIQNHMQRRTPERFIEFVKSTGIAQQPASKQLEILELMKARNIDDIDNEISRLESLKNDGFRNGLRSQEDKAAYQKTIDQLQQMKEDIKHIALDDSRLQLEKEQIAEQAAPVEKQKPEPQQPAIELPQMSGSELAYHQARMQGGEQIANAIGNAGSKFYNATKEILANTTFENSNYQYYVDAFVEKFGRYPQSKEEVDQFIAFMQYEKKAANNAWYALNQ